jgi:hypothetical protein
MRLTRREILRQSSMAFRADSPLVPSGLLGPLKIVSLAR